jgi:hypothetical protein
MFTLAVESQGREDEEGEEEEEEENKHERFDENLKPLCKTS